MALISEAAVNPEVCPFITDTLKLTVITLRGKTGNEGSKRSTLRANKNDEQPPGDGSTDTQVPLEGGGRRGTTGDDCTSDQQAIPQPGKQRKEVRFTAKKEVESH